MVGSAFFIALLAAYLASPRMVIPRDSPPTSPALQPPVADFTTLDPTALLEDWMLVSSDPGSVPGPELLSDFYRPAFSTHP
jgi:hypothetical protein